MSYVVLSNETRQQLDQERSRLMNDRAKIVSEIEAAVSAEVDRAIQTLTALLNETPEVEAVPANDIVEAVTELLEHAATETPTESSRSRSREEATRKTGTKKSESEANEKSAFDAKQLKRKFKGIGLSAAIVQIMQQDSDQIYTIDDLIAGLYDKFDEAEMPRARKTLGATLMHATRAGTVERVGEKPSRFKLGQAATSD